MHHPEGADAPQHPDTSAARRLINASDATGQPAQIQHEAFRHSSPERERPRESLLCSHKTPSSSARTGRQPPARSEPTTVPGTLVDRLRPAGVSRDHDTHRLHAMAPGLVGQTIEQAAGHQHDHPRARSTIMVCLVTGSSGPAAGLSSISSHRTFNFNPNARSALPVAIASSRTIACFTLGLSRGRGPPT